jgi:hypothetical protein
MQEGHVIAYASR